MEKTFSFIMIILFLFVFCFVNLCFSQDFIKLPKPQTDIGKPLMKVLKERRSAREFSQEKLPIQILSNLLWAAYGINRPESSGRTAPSAMNCQDIDIYLAMADGLFLYEPKEHALKLIIPRDVRELTGRQSFVKEAPINLIYVSNFARMTRVRQEEKEFFSGAHTGFIAQNVYLFCASEGLATVVRAMIDRAALSNVINLREDQKITLSQTVGYPKSKGR
jgi:SagB-type dehydrogenase family enzyme